MYKINLKHPTHFETVLKFLGLFSIFLIYFGYLSFKFDLKNGLLLAGLTWSFFVLCTPVADAGFLLDFPIRILFKTRMIFTEIGVWIFAICLNIIALIYNPEIYNSTTLTHLLKTILSTPWPYWGLIFICFIGTMTSVMFGDEMLDVLSHKERLKYHKYSFKYKIIFFVGIIILTLIAYEHLVTQLNIQNLK